jgi:Domain of unknown function (DUF4381)
MLENLRDIHLPAAVSWWPPAIGWWLLTVSLIASLFLFLLYLKKTKMMRQALRLLKRIENEFGQSKDASKCVRELSILLRRMAINKERTCAGLTGPAWLQHLDQGMKEPEFSQGAGKLLLDGPYQPHVEGKEVPQLITLCRKWVVKK